MIALNTVRLPNYTTLGSLVAGGIAADIAWEVWARLITPLIIGGPLQPAALILSLFRLPRDYYGQAEILHLVTGFLFYPLILWGYRTYIHSGSRLSDGVFIGLFTWFLALGVFAPLAGLPFMLGFIKLTWLSGIGHMIYGLTLSFVFRAVADRLERE